MQLAIDTSTDTASLALVPRVLSILTSAVIIASSLLTALPATLVQAASPDPDFTIVVFPDTQNMVALYPDIWQSMADWVVTNKVSQNIQAVVGVGDVVDDFNSTTEWAEAVEGWDKIKNAGIPYVPVIGNHDYNNQYTKVITAWSTYFGTSYFAGKSWFAGTYNGTTDNYFVSLNIGSQNFLIFALEQAPTASVFTWAQSIITANPDSTAIIVTHKYLFSSGEYYSDKNFPGLGLSIWNNFIKLNDNIRIVLCGDAAMAPYTSFRLSSNDASYSVGQLKMTYQNDTNGGNGYMGLLEFRPSLGKVRVTCYSSFLGSFDSSVQYSFDYSQVAPGDANGDGNINILDMTKVARIILLLDIKTPGADANLDGVVNVEDITKIARLILMLD